MEKIWHHTFDLDTIHHPTQSDLNNVSKDSDLKKELDESLEVPKKLLFQPQSLRTMCINTIARLCMTDTRFNATSLAGLPHDLASELLERLKATISIVKCIRSLDKSTYKMSPDGAAILVIPSSNQQPLCILDAKTGMHQVTLKDSLNSDTTKTSNDRNRFIPIRWSNTGRYVYACFQLPYPKKRSTEYLYKVWNTSTGNPLPYTIPFAPCGKLYFSSDDRWLMGKLMDKPLLVYESTTGTLKASLGPASESHKKQKCHDPQHEWIIVPEEGNTQLYDAKSLALVRTIMGELKSISAEGALLATLHEENKTQPESIPHRNRCPYQALIFNRNGQMVCSIPLKDLSWFDMSFTPNSHMLRVFNHSTEHHYSLETGQLIRTLNHPLQSYSDLCFLDGQASKSIIIRKINGKNKNSKTLIIITTSTGNKYIECNNTVKNIRYAHHKDVVALCDSIEVNFLLQLETGTLIPCNFELKKVLFSYLPIKELSCDGYWINRTGSGKQLMHLEHPAPLAPIIAMLRQKMAK
jgi:hypothetical protein